MSHPDVGPERRLYGMMQYLMRHAGHHRPPGTPSARGVVTLQDALDAVLQVAAVIEDQVHAAHLPVERGVHAAAMLMTIRDFVQPLPRGLADEGVTDRVTADLAELVAGLRQARETSGQELGPIVARVRAEPATVSGASGGNVKPSTPSR